MVIRLDWRVYIMSDYNPYDNNNYSNPYSEYNNGYAGTTGYQSYETVSAKEVMPKTFAVMVAALIVTAITSFALAMNETFIYNMFIGSGSRLYFILVFVAEMIAITMTTRFIAKNSMIGAAIGFFAYSILNGATLSVIFVAFDIRVVAKSFFIAALVFGCMAAYGAIVDADLTKVGSIAMMGLIGCLIASLLNAFIFRSSSFDWLISVVVIVVFTALTAYDVQKIKKMAAQASVTGISANTIAIYGAMELYLDFINIFIRLLAIFANNRD